MSGEKGPDEIYCRSCGEVIKRRAEICPECGVRNEAAEGTGGLHTMEHVYCRSCGDRIRREAEICPGCGVRNPLADAGGSAGGGHGGTGPDGPGGAGGGGPPPGGGPAGGQGGTPAQAGEAAPGHDPAEYTTSVSGNWVWGVAASLGLWVLVFALPAEGGLAGLALLVAWGLMPVAVYFDAQWVRANTHWDPNTAVWGLGALVPLVNVLVGLVYLFRRYGVEDYEPDPGDDEPEDDALAELRRRYSRGEIDESQFEARVERILETEDRETARRVVERSRASDGQTGTSDGVGESRGGTDGVETATTRTDRETED